MKFLQRWDYDLHEYQLFMIPADWNVSIGGGDDMDEIINCPTCGKELKLGDSYTSKEVHTNIGIGFCVCEKCYDEEWERRRKYRDE